MKKISVEFDGLEKLASWIKYSGSVNLDVEGVNFVERHDEFSIEIYVDSNAVTIRVLLDNGEEVRLKPLYFPTESDVMLSYIAGAKAIGLNFVAHMKVVEKVTNDVLGAYRSAVAGAADLDDLKDAIERFAEEYDPGDPNEEV